VGDSDASDTDADVEKNGDLKAAVRNSLLLARNLAVHYPLPRTISLYPMIAILPVSSCFSLYLKAGYSGILSIAIPKNFLC